MMKSKQGAFRFTNGWGGRREGAGPKPKGVRAGVSHRTRAPLASRYPAIVTARLRAGLPSLRRRRELRVLIGAFRTGCEREGFRMTQFSVQANHLHLIVEGASRSRVSRGLQGLFIRIAKRLNKEWGRSGSVFADRYHDRILRSPREVRNALRYVLNNGRKHGAYFGERQPDPYSSGRWFDGWKDHVSQLEVVAPLARARTWLLTRGWRRHGWIRLGEVPGIG